MRVDGLDKGTDAEDEGADDDGAAAAPAVGERPDEEAADEGTCLLDADGEGVDACGVAGAVAEVLDEGGEGYCRSWTSSEYAIIRKCVMGNAHQRYHLVATGLTISDQFS